MKISSIALYAIVSMKCPMKDWQSINYYLKYSLVSMFQKVSKESFDSVLLEIKKLLDNNKAQKDLIFNDAFKIKLLFMIY